MYTFSVSKSTRFRSPSMRREWIEMNHCCKVLVSLLSPSMRREWIEIRQSMHRWLSGIRSPSMRREWIEISTVLTRAARLSAVSLHAEGVD